MKLLPTWFRPLYVLLRVEDSGGFDSHPFLDDVAFKVMKGDYKDFVFKVKTIKTIPSEKAVGFECTIHMTSVPKNVSITEYQNEESPSYEKFYQSTAKKILHDFFRSAIEDHKHNDAESVQSRKV